MKFNVATVFAFVAAASAAAHNKRSVDPTAAEASFLAALPTSIQAVLATNTAAAESLIVSELTNPSGFPAWFTALPSEVQLWVETAGASLASAASAPTGAANSTGAATNGTSTVTKVSTSSSTSTKTTSKSSSGSTAAAASSSTGGASMPTAVVGAGIAGAVGLLGMLVL